MSLNDTFGYLPTEKKGAEKCSYFLLVRSIGVLGPLELDFESFHTDLEAVHGLNGRLSAGRIVETDETLFIQTKIGQRYV